MKTTNRSSQGGFHQVKYVSRTDLFSLQSQMVSRHSVTMTFPRSWYFKVGLKTWPAIEWLHGLKLSPSFFTLDFGGQCTDTVNALFTSGLPFIKRSRLSLVDLLKELYKCYEVQARIIKLKRDKDFPKSTSLKVPCFQNSNNIDHSEEKAMIKDIIQNANVELLNVSSCFDSYEGHFG
jgi:hypothetical protein